jgi:hypothetical protein
MSNIILLFKKGVRFILDETVKAFYQNGIKQCSSPGSDDITGLMKN